jgi:hypothetical protein
VYLLFVNGDRKKKQVVNFFLSFNELRHLKTKNPQRMSKKRKCSTENDRKNGFLFPFGKKKCLVGATAGRFFFQIWDVEVQGVQNPQKKIRNDLPHVITGFEKLKPMVVVKVHIMMRKIRGKYFTRSLTQK